MNASDISRNDSIMASMTSQLRWEVELQTDTGSIHHSLEF